MGKFEYRLGTGTAFEAEVECYLRRHWDIESVARNGTEHTHPRFVAQLRSRSDEAAKFIRFAPDGVALPKSGTVFHWEAKCSRYIERDAYESYCRHEQAGCRVLLFLSVQSGVYFNWVSELTFVDSQLVVGAYSPQRQFPVIDGWIYPRRAHNAGELLFGSGTPFREVDLSRSCKLMSQDEWQALITRP
jgi:hypothetical protein